MTTRGQQHGGSRAWGGALVLTVWTLLMGGVPAGAQPPRSRVAVLTPGMHFSLALEGLREGLAQLGYHEGKDLAFLVEDTHGEVASRASRAAKIVEAHPDVIFTIGTALTIAAKQATTTLPIVFVFVGDPLRSGLIASYASSQNNVTGIANYAGPLSGKRLEVLQEVVLGVKRVLAVVATHEENAQIAFQRLAETAQKLAIQVLRHDVTTREESSSTSCALRPPASWTRSIMSPRSS